MTLSSSEAEYFALSESDMEVKFILMLLKIMSLEVKLPITIRVYHLGAIFMSENVLLVTTKKHAADFILLIYEQEYKSRIYIINHKSKTIA